MKWKRGRVSRNIEDRRGQGGLGGGRFPMPMGVGGGLGGIVLLVAFLILSNLGGSGTGGLDDVLGEFQNPGSQGGEPLQADPDDRMGQFVSFVLDDAQGFWDRSFSEAGKQYHDAKLVLFDASTSSACGGAYAQTGPHYCPPDQTIYIDLDFFRDLRDRFGAPGDFAQAYVLAHEIAHHVQNELGIMDEVNQIRQDDSGQANELSIKLELQADCLAGVWAHTTYERDLLDSGDLEEGLNAAAAVGDDRIQSQSGGGVNKETWTHGSSKQRVTWFKRGFESGDPEGCDTFS
jgi:predicted metalloprotease